MYRPLFYLLLIHFMTSCTDAARKVAEEVGKSVHERDSISELIMDDETKYVLDWWKSLDIRDPFVFQYTNFMQDLGGGIPASDFKGFS